MFFELNNKIKKVLLRNPLVKLQMPLGTCVHRHSALTKKALNSFRLVDEPIIELQNNCERTEIIIFRSFMKKTNKAFCTIRQYLNIIIHEYFKKKKLTIFKAYDWSNLKQLCAVWNFFTCVQGGKKSSTKTVNFLFCEKFVFLLEKPCYKH